MRTIVLASSREEKKMSIRSGPGAPIFENYGSQTRIYRAPCRAIATVTLEDKEIYGQIMDLSPGGCLLKTETTLEVGTTFDMRVTIVHVDRRSIAEVRGVIRRCGEDGGRKTYGVEFVSEDASERRNLDWLYGQALSE